MPRLIAAFLALFLVPMAIGLVWPPKGATCRDGWASPSIGRQGACSHDGGVDRSIGLRGLVVLVATLGTAAFIAMGPTGRKQLREDLSERKEQQRNQNQSRPPRLSSKPTPRPTAQRAPDESRRSPVPAHRATTGKATTRVRCPTCGSAMVKRMARTGPRRGRKFYGCSRYPACRGTRSIGS